MNKLPILKDLHIRITSKCNFNCPHCYAADWFKDNLSLGYYELKSAITQAIELGCKKVTFTGGEPLVSDCISDIVKFCLCNNLRVEIETNGYLINDLIENLKGEITKVEFGVSYDGEEMRGNNTTPTVRNNIAKLVHLGCNVKIQTVLTKLNISEIDNILNFSGNLGIKNRVFLAHSPNGNGKNLELLDINEWLKIVKLLKEKYPHAIVELPDVLSGGTQKKCGWGVHRCEIMPNGDVTSCGPITFNKRGFKAGNTKVQKLKDIWASEHFEYIRNLKQIDFEGLCSKCVFWKTCLGACRSISYSTGGNLLSPHPFCVSLYKNMKNDKLDKDLIPDIQIIYKWIKELENPNFKYEQEYYNSIVKKQHKLT